MRYLPLFYFPTSVIYVDDDLASIDAFSHLLDDELELLCYTDSKKVLEYFSKYKSPLDSISFTNKVFDIDDQNTQATIQLDISKIIQLIKSKVKYDEVSVLLTDYHMSPNLDGLELCKALKGQRIKKMLLTQLQDYELAKSALNSGVIDFFANKSDHLEQVESTLVDLAKHYFSDMTATLLQHLETNKTSPFSDPVFIRFFNDLVGEHSISEYYLIDKNGSYLLITKDDKRYVLIVHTDNSLEEFVDLLKEYNKLDEVIKLIENKEYIPFFGIEKSLTNSVVSKINNYLFKAQLLEGKQKYYVHFTEYKF